jgi:hypothetical protein
VGDVKFSVVEVQKRLVRTSSPPRPNGKVRGDLGLFKVPPVPIMVEGISLSLRLDEFFGRAEGDTENYISNPDAVISFIIGLGSGEMRRKATKHLLGILPRFGEERPFLEMTELANVICELDHGPGAALIFLEKIDEKSKDEQNNDILVKLMPAFNSSPIRGSFGLFSIIGKANMESAASQIVTLGLSLKDADTIIKIGETILKLDNKFGMHTTYGYRTAVLDIAKKGEMHTESRVNLMRKLSDKIVSLEDDMDVIDFTRMIERIFLTERNPEERIAELCRKKTE